jgi:hypothetical protein
MIDAATQRLPYGGQLANASFGVSGNNRECPQSEGNEVIG